MIDVDAPMPEFALDNIEGLHIQSNDISDQVLVLVFATQQHVKTLDKWYTKLTQTFGNQSVMVLPIGILNALPSFVPESAVRVRVKQKTQSPLLMDMKGKVANEFGIVEDGVYVVVADQAHIIRFVLQGPDNNDLNVLMNLVDKLATSKSH